MPPATLHEGARSGKVLNWEHKDSVDQIFDRLERLIKSWVTPDTEDTFSRAYRGSGDADFEDAMSELDDFLGKDRSAAEANRRERERREREAAARAEAPRRPGPSAPPTVVVEAYKYLGLPVGVPMKEVKAAYKRLLLRYHPDRNSGNPAEQKRSTEISARINAAYKTIETWTATGKVQEN